ncbi:ribose ABC transporter [Loktanella sp. D2R18]|uniref:RbsD/FucU family protein n=1 Tax=Rhodobacterales TaxID=204455 RepID=UPI000DEAAF3C|nr:MULTISPECIES: RbsD/FucU domain-containing protein [Rhodobacterales]MDO6590038.1 RbsD/FucU domain-containing protein [Yoonia sp. 1_MG-2023]RBW45828.1 ribose ABC transporter [Loktanella sp. D2R18]
MLHNIPPILSPDLLWTLRAMGHGDEIVIADANFPAEGLGPKTIRLDGNSATDTLAAVVQLLPLDIYVPTPAHTMKVVDAPDTVPEIVTAFQTLLPDHKIGSIERFSFYERAAKAFAIVQTGETRLYGNIILTKGVIGS